MPRFASTKKLAAPLFAVAIVVTGSLIAATSASAEPNNEIDYSTTGNTVLTNPNSHVTVTFAKTLMRTFITPGASGSTLNLKADLPLAPVTTSFKAFGKIPAKGTVVFTQVAPIAGVVNLDNSAGKGYALTAAGQYVVTLRDVTYNNKRFNVGTNCQTIHPLNVKVSAEPGFDLSTGTLTGTYFLGDFWNCGKLQHKINETLPGKKNAITLKIKNVPPPSS